MNVELMARPASQSLNILSLLWETLSLLFAITTAVLVISTGLKMKVLWALMTSTTFDDSLNIKVGSLKKSSDQPQAWQALSALDELDYCKENLNESM